MRLKALKRRERSCTIVSRCWPSASKSYELIAWCKWIWTLSIRELSERTRRTCWSTAFRNLKRTQRDVEWGERTRRWLLHLLSSRRCLKLWLIFVNHAVFKARWSPDLSSFALESGCRVHSVDQRMEWSCRSVWRYLQDQSTRHSSWKPIRLYHSIWNAGTLKQ